MTKDEKFDAEYKNQEKWIYKVGLMEAVTFVLTAQKLHSDVYDTHRKDYQDYFKSLLNKIDKLEKEVATLKTLAGIV